MNAKTDAPPPAAPSTPARRKPRFALFIATACGLGYIPIAPGTWGSLVGVILYCAADPRILSVTHSTSGLRTYSRVGVTHVPLTAIAICILLGIAGVWVSDRAAKYSGMKDPQFVVIDEVSGQFLAYLLALGSTLKVYSNGAGTTVAATAPLNWKYLLLGFILFRVFDIWKPFPARQAEALPGGWGIMADDWVAGIYAALGLWIARAFLHL